MNAAPAVLVEFAAAPGPESGGWVTRKAPVIFRAGRYEFADAPPFEMTPAELKAAAQSFEPVPLFDTHRSETSVFHGKLGELAAVEPTPDGAALAGTLRVPGWLDRLYKGVALPLSATWDRATKRLKNLALLTNPRIADAAAFEAQLEAAFAAAHPEATPVSTQTVAAPAVVATPAPDADARLRELERREAEWKARLEASEARQKESDAKFAAERRKSRHKAAAEFAAALIHGERHADGNVTPGQFNPAARQALTRLAEFCLAHQDEHGDAAFSNDDGTEARAGLLAVLREAVANLRPRALSAEELRGSAEFGHDPGEKPGDEFEAVDKAVDAEIERQRKARGQQTNGRGA